ncbi:MAG: Stk1 family PASTA domain-containing Ser/Thr kinase [Eubacteriales bacterium]
MIQVGMLLSERYDILEQIGTGGMADIYKAKCNKLNRLVAIKVLKQEFSENKDFIGKFRIEAQATAGLAHPNIVNVYDVGEEDNMHYIVMELVEGITLKHYIEKKVSLSVKEAISIAIQIATGIEEAHNNHIIHRDIKPQNIMISKDGKVKVADFGIAKAATSNTVTTNIMGSVHYTSPEQARGGFSDEKSDIYSLGISMYEMVTGRVPFNGETTVAIAIQHIQEKMPSPKKYMQDIPYSFEQIILKCTEKSPDRRYSKADELIEDLKKSLMNPEGDFVQIIDNASQDQTRMISEHDHVEIKRKVVQQPVAQVIEQDSAKSERKGRKATGIKVSTNRAKKQELVKQEQNKEKIFNIIMILIGVVIALIILYVTADAIGIFQTDDTIINLDEQDTINLNIIGMNIEQVKELLDGYQIPYEVTYERSSDYDKDLVIKTSVEGEYLLEEDEVIILTVGSGMDGVSLPDVLNLSAAEAIVQLEDNGFVVVRESEYHETVVKGNVIRQTPNARETLERGKEVIITISDGIEENKVRVPEVLGMTESKATETLEAEGLKCEVSTETDYTKYAVGMVSYQSYESGTFVEVGTTLQLRLSIGGGQYSCNVSVDAPIDYISGQAVVTLTTEEGGEIFHTTVDSFPTSIKISGIKNASSGTLKIAYTITAEDVVTDADGVTSVQMINVPQTETRTINFTLE